MKFYYLCLFFLPFFISCSNSTDTANKNSFHRFAETTVDMTAVNNGNPYDIAGQLHNQLLLSYCYGENIPMTLTGVINVTTSLANEMPTFMNLTQGKTYSFLASERVAYIVSHIDSCPPEIINASLATDSAKIGFRDFISTLLSLCAKEDDYAIIYKYVRGYEDSVLNDKTLTEQDRRIILITTSIARHSAYTRKKKPKQNKDPEWLLMVGNIMAATEGATVSTEEAIMRGLITGIVENKM